MGTEAIADLKADLDRRGLARVWAWGHPRGLESGSSAEAFEDLILHVDVAARLGAGVMRICAGGRGTRPARWAEHKAALVPMLTRAAEVARDKGVVLADENHLDLYAGEMRELMLAVDSPALGVCLDTANNLRLFEDPVEVARVLVPWARATHVKDIRSHRGDPRSLAFWPSVPLGEGSVDLAAILGVLDAAGYDGLLALEIDLLHPDWSSEEAAIGTGLQHLRRLLAELHKR